MRRGRLFDRIKNIRGKASKRNARELVENIRAAQPEPYANIVCPDAHAYQAYVADFYSGGGKIPFRMVTEAVAGPKEFSVLRPFDQFRARPGDPILVVKVQDSYVVLGAIGQAIGEEEPPSTTIPPDICEDTVTFGNPSTLGTNPFGGENAVIHKDRYLISGNQIQARIEIGDLTTGGEIFDIDVPGGFESCRVATYEDTLYFTVDNILHIYDITDPGSPVAGTNITLSFNATILYQDGLFLYISDGSTEFQVFFLANASAPSLIRSYTASANITGITGSGTKIFIATAGDSLEAWDFTNVAAAFQASIFSTPDTSNQGRYMTYIDEKIIYYDSANNLARSIDAQDLTALFLLRTWSPSVAGVWNMDVVGRIAYIFGDSQVEAWDIADIDNSLPIRVASRGYGAGSHDYGVASESWVVIHQDAAFQFRIIPVAVAQTCTGEPSQIGDVRAGQITADAIIVENLTVTQSAEFEGAVTIRGSLAVDGVGLFGGGVQTFSQIGIAVRPYGTDAGQTGEVRLYELAANGQHYVAHKAPDSLIASYTLIWPTSNSAGALTNDGAGNLSWASPAPAAHATTHEVGGSDPLTGLLDATARVAIRKNSGANVGSRRRLNLIEGSNISITATDDSGSEEIDITLAATVPTVGQYREFIYEVDMSGDVNILTDQGDALFELRDLV